MSKRDVRNIFFYERSGVVQLKLPETSLNYGTKKASTNAQFHFGNTCLEDKSYGMVAADLCTTVRELVEELNIDPSRLSPFEVNWKVKKTR